MTSVLRPAALALVAGLVATAAAAQDRVVSVGGGVTEILYALGQEQRLVAVDTTSLYPAEATRLPNVGYIRALSPEGVLAMAPDLILMEADAGPPDAVSVIESAGVEIVRAPSGHGAEELLEKIRVVAAAVGHAADGEAMAAAAAADLAALSEALAAVETPRRVLFVLSVVDGRVMAAGQNTGADAMIGLAGAENVFAEADGYKTISPEAAAALQPDVILMMDRGDGATDDPLALPALAATPAGRAGAVIRMDALYLLGFGPRTAAAARDLAARLYPDLELAAGQ